MALRVYRDPDGDEETPASRGSKRWDWQHLLLGTIVLSVAGAMCFQSGLAGAVGTLVSAWLLILGAAILRMSLTARARGWLLSVIAGASLALVGVLGLYCVATMDPFLSGDVRLFGSWDLVTTLLACVFGFAIWDVFRTKWTILIVAGPDGIKRQKGLPRHRADVVLDYVRGMKLNGPVKIRALRNAHGSLVLRCDGALSMGERQRLRNFLVEHL